MIVVPVKPVAENAVVVLHWDEVVDAVVMPAVFTPKPTNFVQSVAVTTEQNNVFEFAEVVGSFGSEE
jgi:hypothetical protein